MTRSESNAQDAKQMAGATKAAAAANKRAPTAAARSRVGARTAIRCAPCAVAVSRPRIPGSASRRSSGCGR